MSWQSPSGEAVPLPVRVPKRRGRTLSAAQARRLRDLLCFVLIRVLGLSLADCVAVINLGASPDHVTKRLRACPLDERAVLDLLRGARRAG